MLVCFFCTIFHFILIWDGQFPLHWSLCFTGYMTHTEVYTIPPDPTPLQTCHPTNQLLMQWQWSLTGFPSANSPNCFQWNAWWSWKQASAFSWHYLGTEERVHWCGSLHSDFVDFYRGAIKIQILLELGRSALKRMVGAESVWTLLVDL